MNDFNYNLIKNSVQLKYPAPTKFTRIKTFPFTLNWRYMYSNASPMVKLQCMESYPIDHSNQKL